MGRKSTQHSAISNQPAKWARALESVALLGLLLIIAMRPLISETYDSTLPPIDRAAGVTGSPTPATTACLDLGLLICYWVAAIALLFQRIRWRWTGLEIGWLLMLAAAILSTLLASNKRLSANASADWLATTLLVLILPNVCRNRWHVGLVLIVLVASGLVSVVKDVMQVRIEFPETRVMYFHDRSDFWAQQHIPLDDPRVELYERRIKSTAASGFFPHSNVQAALLSLCGFAVMALAGLLWRRRAACVAFIVVGGVLIAAIAITASKGGFAAAFIGLALLVCAWRWVHAIQTKWRTAAIGLLSVSVLGVLAVVVYGRLHGGLPGSSLQFRWEYWQVTWHIIRDHFWTGVGALNFDRAYLMYKPIQFPEEIKDPHGFLLSVLSQWGVLGFVGMLWILGVGCYRSLSLIGRSTPIVERAQGKGWVRGWIAALIMGFLLLRLLLMRDYWASGDPGSRALVMFDLELYGVLWALIVGVLVWTFATAAGNGRYNAANLTTDPGEPVNRARIALLCGAIVFLLHNLIEFSILYPGTLTPFAAIAGVLLARADHGEPQESGRSVVRGLVPPIALLIFIGLFTRLVLAPVGSADEFLREARSAHELSHAELSYRAAIDADPWDPVPAADWGELLLHAYQPADAIRAAQIAIARDPLDKNLHQLLARAAQLDFERGHDPGQLRAAVDAARRAVALYPASPDDHAGLAGLLGYAAKQLHSRDLAVEAVRQYQTALDLDAARPGTDEVRRWSPQRRQELQRLARIASGLATTTSWE